MNYRLFRELQDGQPHTLEHIVYMLGGSKESILGEIYDEEVNGNLVVEKSNGSIKLVRIATKGDRYGWRS